MCACAHVCITMYVNVCTLGMVTILIVIYSSLAVINIVPFLLLTFNHEEKVDVPPSKNQALCQLNKLLSVLKILLV